MHYALTSIRTYGSFELLQCLMFYLFINPLGKLLYSEVHSKYNAAIEGSGTRFEVNDSGSCGALKKFICKNWKSGVRNIFVGLLIINAFLTGAVAFLLMQPESIKQVLHSPLIITAMTCLVFAMGISQGALFHIHTDLFSGLLPTELRSAGSNLFFLFKGIVQFFGICGAGGVQVSAFNDK